MFHQSKSRPIQLTNSRLQHKQQCTRIPAGFATVVASVPSQYIPEEEEEPKKLKRKMCTRGTQSVYRESSAQTLPYLVTIAPDKITDLHKNELFKMATELTISDHPGVKEVEKLERARRRWQYAENCQQDVLKTSVATKMVQLSRQHRRLYKLFGWERTMEREADLLDEQELRLNYVVQCMNRRSNAFRENADKRIQMRFEMEKVELQKFVQKNRIQYQRELRRIEKSSKIFKDKTDHRVGSKNTILKTNGIKQRKQIEPSNTDFEMQILNMKDFVCPFAKVKRWSKPKERLREIEQNFCTDKNLQKLYESLKVLRVESSKKLLIPKYQFTKQFLQNTEEPHNILENINVTDEIEESEDEEENEVQSDTLTTASSHKLEQEPYDILPEAYKQTLATLFSDSPSEELVALLTDCDNKTLSDIMTKMHELRNSTADIKFEEFNAINNIKIENINITQFMQQLEIFNIGENTEETQDSVDVKNFEEAGVIVKGILYDNLIPQIEFQQESYYICGCILDEILLDYVDILEDHNTENSLTISELNDDFD